MCGRWTLTISLHVCAASMMVSACESPRAATDAGTDAFIASDVRVDAIPTVGNCGSGAACDPVAQNCPSGEGCYPGVMGLRCAPRGVVGDGTACVRDVDCRPGLFCAGPDGTSVCTRLCCPLSSGGCALNSVCVGFAGATYGACVASCDARMQTGCAVGESCYPIDGRGRTACFLPGLANQGDSCSTPNACAPRLACLAPRDATSRCVRVCTDGMDCAAGQVCRTLAGSVSVCETR